MKLNKQVVINATCIALDQIRLKFFLRIKFLNSIFSMKNDSSNMYFK